MRSPGRCYPVSLAIIESMKMEMTVPAPASGILREFRVAPGRTVRAGELIAVLDAD